MHLSSQVGIGSKEQDFAGTVDSSLMLSCTDVGSSSVSSSNVPWDDWRGCCSGGRADLGNLVYEDVGEVVGTELVVTECDGGCSMLLTVFNSARGLRRHVSIVDIE